VYLAYLNCVRGHHEGIVSAETMAEYDEWFRNDYMGRFNAVLLEGPVDVIRRTEELHGLLIAIRDKARGEQDSRENHQPRAGALARRLPHGL
jgi:hypothetical protein